MVILTLTYRNVRRSVTLPAADALLAARMVQDDHGTIHGMRVL